MKNTILSAFTLVAVMLSSYSYSQDSIRGNDQDNYTKSIKGTMDAERYHGKQAEHLLLGCVGIYGVAGTALLSEPSPYNDPKTMALSPNRDLFNDPSYLTAYEKRAKRKNINNAAIGWGVSRVAIAVLAVVAWGAMSH